MEKNTRRGVLRLAEVGVALAIVWILVQIFGFYRDFTRDSVPATAFFEVIELHVPDHRAGQDPQIDYDRTIVRPFRGFWVAEIQERAGDGTRAVCFRPGAANYDPEDRLPENVSLGWFLHSLCDLEPGTYRIQVGWDILAEGYPLKQVSFFSNWFTVFPPE